MTDHRVLVITVPPGTDVAPIEAAVAAIAAAESLRVQRHGPDDFCLERCGRRANVVGLFDAVARALRRTRTTTPLNHAA